MSNFKINNRRYTGSKYKLLDWIKNTIEDETQKNEIFCDLFAGTGCVAEKFTDKKNLIIVSLFIIFSIFGYFIFEELKKKK